LFQFAVYGHGISEKKRPEKSRVRVVGSRLLIRRRASMYVIERPDIWNCEAVETF